jgi:hypothetical protein
MADPIQRPDTGDDTGVGAGREPTTGTPRWQKVVGIVGLVLVLLFVVFVILQVTGVGGGLGDHTPGPPDGGH